MTAANIAPQVTRSSGKRMRLRRVQRRAVPLSIIPGSAFSKASALGMKSNADQTRMMMCDASAMSSQNRTPGIDHAATSATTSMISNAVCAAIQKRLREIPPRPGWMRSGRPGQNGSTTMNSYKPPPRLTSASEAQTAVTEIRRSDTPHPTPSASEEHNKSNRRISVLCQKRTCAAHKLMSALGHKRKFCNVCTKHVSVCCAKR